MTDVPETCIGLYNGAPVMIDNRKIITDLKRKLQIAETALQWYAADLNSSPWYNGEQAREALNLYPRKR